MACLAVIAASQFIPFQAIAQTNSSPRAVSQQTSATEERLDATQSVIVEWTKDADELQTIIENLVTPPVEDLQQELGRKLEELVPVTAALVSKPDDKQLQAAHEQIVSDALAMAMQGLNRYPEIGPQVRQTIQDAIKAGEKTLDRLKTTQQTEAGLVAQNKAQVAKIDVKLKELAGQFQLENDAPLPLHIDHVVQTLYLQRQTLSRDTELSNTAATDLSAMVEMVEDYLTAVKVQGNELDLAFRTVDGQRMHLSRIARFRAQRAIMGKTSSQMMAVLDRMNHLGNGIRRMIVASDNVPTAVNITGLQLPDFKAAQSTGARSGRDILRDILKTPPTTVATPAPIAKR